MKKLFSYLITSTVIAVVLFSFTTPAFAACTGQCLTAATSIGTIGGLVDAITQNIVKALATLFIAAGVAAFFFGVTKFIWGMREGVEKKVTEGKQFMGWGLVALFVMVSVWGIILSVQDIIGIKGKTDIMFPTF